MVNRQMKIANHQGNANENHSGVSPHICQHGCYQKTPHVWAVWMWRKWNSYTLLVVLVHLLWKTVWRFLKKCKIELPYDLSIPLLSIHLNKTNALTCKDICTPVFMVAL